jgi:DNA polymerase-1
VTRAYEWCDRPLVPVLAEMEMAGIAVDREELARLSAAYSVEIERLEGEVFEAAGGPFTIGSPKQLGEVLFERLKLPGRQEEQQVRPMGHGRVRAERLGDEHPVPKLVLEWRQLTKLRSTYTDALQAQINPATGRVHTSFSMAVAVTGRCPPPTPTCRTSRSARPGPAHPPRLRGRTR